MSRLAARDGASEQSRTSASVRTRALAGQPPLSASTPRTPAGSCTPSTRRRQRSSSGESAPPVPAGAGRGPPPRARTRAARRAETARQPRRRAVADRPRRHAVSSFRHQRDTMSAFDQHFDERAPVRHPRAAAPRGRGRPPLASARHRRRWRPGPRGAHAASAGGRAEDAWRPDAARAHSPRGPSRIARLDLVAVRPDEPANAQPRPAA